MNQDVHDGRWHIALGTPKTVRSRAITATDRALSPFGYCTLPDSSVKSDVNSLLYLHSEDC